MTTLRSVQYLIVALLSGVIIGATITMLVINNKLQDPVHITEIVHKCDDAGAR